MSFIEQADEYRGLGFCIMPLKKRDKKPMLPWEKWKDSKPSDKAVESWKRDFSDCNIAIITGKVSNLVVLDIDGPEGEEAIKGKHLPPTMIAKTGKGRHYYFKLPNGETFGNFVGILPKVDIRCDGGYVVAPGSVHPSGSLYEWQLKEDLAECPEWLVSLMKKGKAPVPHATAHHPKTAPSDIEAIKNGVASGGRNQAAAKLIGYYAAKSYEAEDIVAIVREWNRKNTPPLTDEELQITLTSIFKRATKAQQMGEVAEEAPEIDLKTCKNVISKWLYHKDDNIVDVVLATVASVYHTGDPLWVMIIGAPSSGKTEIMRGFDKHQDCYFIDRVTPATFVTGFTKAKGILERMGPDPKTFVVQDFSTILSKPPYDRMEIMDTLRQMYNGSYYNEWGNGKRFAWKGKVSMIAGCTPDIEASNHSMSELGERFMYYRVESDDDDTRNQMMQKARDMEGLEKKAREEISIALHGVMASIKKMSFDDIKMDKVY